LSVEEAISRLFREVEPDPFCGKGSPERRTKKEEDGEQGKLAV
jgi:Txe/YoeB family toxin of Txe-Axe toxin-antitoxin module